MTEKYLLVKKKHIPGLMFPEWDVTVLNLSTTVTEAHAIKATHEYLLDNPDYDEVLFAKIITKATRPTK